MIKTGTLSNLINAREYTKDEQIVLNYFFTNIDKNIYCARDTLPSQVWAFLMWQYSRSHLSLRDRFLKVFEDQKTAFEQWKITKDEFISLEDLAISIANSNDNKLQFFYDKAAWFLKKWWVQYGHNSLKDSDTIRFAVEWVSEVFTKIIESPFPALGAFQETSTRYMPFNKDSIIFPPELENSKYKEEIKQALYSLFDVYEKWLVIVRQSLLDNWIFKREEFSSDWAFNTTLNTKVFDICRYLLPSATATKLGCGFQTRTLETHLSWMLSHPLEEARTVAKAIWEEAIKISPWLLSHVEQNEYEIERQKDLESWSNSYFEWKNINQKEYKWIMDDERIKLISIGNMDDEILASIIFESSRRFALSYSECQNEVKIMSQDQKKELMEKTLSKRWQFDRMPRSILHSSVLVEFLMDFWAFRDLQRHRATDQIWQWVTAIHWYDYPEYIDLPWMEEFKNLYDWVMSELTRLSKLISEENQYLVEYCAALWHLIRTTFEMDAGQLAYIIELRTTPQAHHSYRNLIIRLYEEISKKAPIFSKYIRVWSGTSSRKEEAERIENKNK